MKWIKKGQILSFSKNGNKLNGFHYSQNPKAIVLEDRIRVFFNTRKRLENHEQKAFPVFIDLCKKDLSKILELSFEPLLEFGEKGAFDEFGIMSSSVVNVGSSFYMYYVGWTRMHSVPYNWAIGVAKSDDKGNTFRKLFRGPIVGAIKDEPFLQNGCFVKVPNGNNKWHMWYSTGQKWIDCKGKMESMYSIVQATSLNGMDWERNGKRILPQLREYETQTTPVIFKKGGLFHMYFSYRNSVDFRQKDGGYRIGYATSLDMNVWKREDYKAGIHVSEYGWDSEMICYPDIVDIDGRLVMFYCGNDFGKDGFGYAVLEEE